MLSGCIDIYHVVRTIQVGLTRQTSFGKNFFIHAQTTLRQRACIIMWVGWSFHSYQYTTVCSLLHGDTASILTMVQHKHIPSAAQRSTAILWNISTASYLIQLIRSVARAHQINPESPSMYNNVLPPRSLPLLFFFSYTSNTLRWLITSTSILAPKQHFDHRHSPLSTFVQHPHQLTTRWAVFHPSSSPPVPTRMITSVRARSALTCTGASRRSGCCQIHHLRPFEAPVGPQSFLWTSTEAGRAAVTVRRLVFI